MYRDNERSSTGLSHVVIIQATEQYKYFTLDKAKLDCENHNLNLFLDLHKNLDSNVLKYLYKKHFC